MSRRDVIDKLLAARRVFRVHANCLKSRVIVQILDFYLDRDPFRWHHPVVSLAIVLSLHRPVIPPKSVPQNDMSESTSRNAPTSRLVLAGEIL